MKISKIHQKFLIVFLLFESLQTEITGQTLPCPILIDMADTEREGPAGHPIEIDQQCQTRSENEELGQGTLQQVSAFHHGAFRSRSIS